MWSRPHSAAADSIHMIMSVDFFLFLYISHGSLSIEKELQMSHRTSWTDVIWVCYGLHSQSMKNWWCDRVLQLQSNLYALSLCKPNNGYQTDPYLIYKESTLSKVWQLLCNRSCKQPLCLLLRAVWAAFARNSHTHHQQTNLTTTNSHHLPVWPPQPPLHADDDDKNVAMPCHQPNGWRTTMDGGDNVSACHFNGIKMIWHVNRHATSSRQGQHKWSSLSRWAAWLLSLSPMLTYKKQGPCHQQWHGNQQWTNKWWLLTMTNDSQCLGEKPNPSPTPHFKWEAGVTSPLATWQP